MKKIDYRFHSIKIFLMKNHLLIFLLSLIANSSLAQTPISTISGIVIDNQTGLGIGGLTVRLEQKSWMEVQTTDDGKYHFKGEFKVGNTYSFDIVDPKKRYSPQRATDLRTLEGGTLEAIKLVKPAEEVVFIIHDWENKGKMLSEVTIKSNAPLVKKIIVDGFFSLPKKDIKFGKTFFLFEREGYEPVNLDNLIEEEHMIYIPMRPKIKETTPPINRAGFETKQKKTRALKKTTFQAMPQSGEKYVWNFGDGQEEVIAFRPTVEKQFKKKGIYEVHLTVFKNNTPLSYSSKINVKRTNTHLFLAGGLLLTAATTDAISDAIYKDYKINPNDTANYDSANNWHHISIVSLYAGIGVPVVWELIQLLQKGKKKGRAEQLKVQPIPVKDLGLIENHPSIIGLTYHF